MKKKFVMGPEESQERFQRIRLTASTMLSLRMVEEALAKIFKERVCIEHTDIIITPIRRGGSFNKKDTGQHERINMFEGMVGNTKFYARLRVIRQFNLWFPGNVQVQIEDITHNFVYENKPDDDGNLVSTIKCDGNPEKKNEVADRLKLASAYEEVVMGASPVS